MAKALISSGRYNVLQGRLNQIMGTGTSGYGQVVLSNQVAATERVLESDINSLYRDMVNARTHQTGTEPTSIQEVTTADLIAADNSLDPTIPIEQTWSSYESLMTTIETDKRVIHSSQADLVNAGANAVRTTAWGGPASAPQEIIHRVKFTFVSATAIRHWFNAGGELRMSATLTGYTNTKGGNWAAMFTAMGNIRFNYTGMFSTNSVGTSTTLTPYNLTTTETLGYSKAGSAVYADNLYSVYANTENSGKTLVITIRLTDDANGSGGADEPVDGTLTSIIDFYKPDGTYVDLDVPSSNKVNSL